MTHISILTTSHNGAEFIIMSVASILQQDFTDWEYLIRDDGSTDDTPSLLSSIDDSRVRIISDDLGHIGIGSSINVLLSHSKGLYVAIQEQDDISYPNRLRTQCDILSSFPDAGITCGQGVRINRLGAYSHNIPIELVDITIKYRMLFDNPLFHASVMYRKSLLDEAGGYTVDPRFSYCEDYELFSRLLPLTMTHNSTKCLVAWRRHSASASEARTKDQESSKARIRDRIVGSVFKDSYQRQCFDAYLALFESPKGEHGPISSGMLSYGVAGLIFLIDGLADAFRVNVAELREFRNRLLVKCGKHVIRLVVDPKSPLTIETRRGGPVKPSVS